MSAPPRLARPSRGTDQGPAHAWRASRRQDAQRPFILLNLLLSSLAAMQGASLLIAAKRSDQIASELAEHDYETDCRAEQLIETLTQNLTALREDHRQMRAHLVTVTGLLDSRPAG